jgi:predicted TPR repeat methyltransferase
VWLNYGSAAQSANDTKAAIKAYGAFLKIAPNDANAPQVKTILKQLKTAPSSATSQ